MATILCPDCSQPVSVHDASCTTCGRLTPRVTPHRSEGAPTTDLAVPHLTVPRSTTAFPLTLSFKTLALAESSRKPQRVAEARSRDRSCGSDPHTLEREFTFPEAGEYAFACFMPGHCESGISLPVRAE